MPECLECKTELEFDDTVDTYEGVVDIVMEVHGHCPQCGKLYKWKDIYRHIDFQNLEERD